MNFIVGFTKNEYQISYFNVDNIQKNHELVTMDLDRVKELPLNILMLNNNLDVNTLDRLLADEKKFYPIVNSNEFAMDYEKFSSLSFDELNDYYQKISGRFILANNIKAIEDMVSTVKYLKNLWNTDRNHFFEELWLVLKTNLNTSSLSIIFNDLSTTGAEGEEKHKLVQACLKGEKVPNFYEGTDKEKFLMKTFEKDFNETFHVSNFNAQKGQLVLTATINQSPVLIMAETMSFNQLQRSVLTGIFKGLQKD